MNADVGDAVSRDGLALSEPRDGWRGDSLGGTLQQDGAVDDDGLLLDFTRTIDSWRHWQQRTNYHDI